jgi:hypothetical protein
MYVANKLAKSSRNQARKYNWNNSLEKPYNFLCFLVLKICSFIELFFVLKLILKRT